MTLMTSPAPGVDTVTGFGQTSHHPEAIEVRATAEAADCSGDRHGDLAGPHDPARLGAAGRTHRSARGMVSAEWAVGIIAAIAIAGVLLAVVTSGPVQEALLRFILSVINLFSSGFKN